jgi:hypothetical protein
MEKVIIIANLGRVRALKFREAGLDPQEQDHLDEESGSPFEMRIDKISDVVTDQAGRFPQRGPTGGLPGMSQGEEHELEAELENRALQRVADKIDEIVAAENYPPWLLMATREVLPHLEKALPTAARASLARRDVGDLTKMPLADLEKRLLVRA